MFKLINLGQSIRLALFMGLGLSALVRAQPLTSQAGDPVQGQAIVLNRQQGLCVLCHQVPGGESRFQGNLAPDLRGVGSRLDASALRLRIVDSQQINPQSIMPAYYRTTGLSQVAPAFTNKTLLRAQDIEDVVAFLLTLKP
jgi:sulfur-oxidizing protein SoxX